ncbi:hypothetical protein HHI36_008505 [Cryptolaemus montrouzieri]|uniref:Uncharacterized protein n=1 Tax=Cryptolaemus montrouzieri TaxID=559131 RepID=A0ABD2MT58_9CUCU
MLIKLIEYHEVIELIILILDDSKYCSDTDKWLRWSRNVFNCFLIALKTNKYRLDSIESFDSVRKLIFSLNPNVFRPIDDIIVMLFQEPPSLHQDISLFTRWMGKILSILIILSPVKEDIILTKISSSKNNFVPNSVFENIVITPDPLNVTNSADFFQHLSPEIILIRFIFRTLTLATKKCTLIVEEGEDTFFIRELSIFMMFCLHNFQSGFLCKTANMAISIIEKSKYAEECDAISMDPINDNFRDLSFFYPTLIFQWCYFLTLLSYEDRKFWSSVLKLPEDDKNPSAYTFRSLNREVVKVGADIVFCDYLCENAAKETDDIYWLLKSNVNVLIDLIQEAPISEFFSFIHREPNYSRQFLMNVEQLSLTIRNVIFKLKLLKSIENAHPNVTGQLIKLLLCKMIHTKEPAEIKEISKLSTRKLELLLTMPPESVYNQLSKQELLEIISSLNHKDSCTKYEALIGLLNKVGSKFYNLSSQKSQSRTIDANYIKHLDIDKTWYVSLINSKLGNAKIGKEVAQILSILNYEEQMKILDNGLFDILILKECIAYGVNIYENSSTKEVPELLKVSVDFYLKKLVV